MGLLAVLRKKPEQIAFWTRTVFFPVDRTSNLCRSTMPNSCCHTSCALFNVLSVIATRLKPLLNVIIVTEQTGGTQDRDVADNLSHFKNVIGYHATATGKRKSKGKGKAVIVSLDFEKAFDRLDRTFLYELMMKLGFSKTFLDLIKTLYEGNIWNRYERQGYHRRAVGKRGEAMVPSPHDVLVHHLH